MASLILRLGALCALSVALALAQDWQNSDVLPSVDLSGLTPAQKASALKVLRSHDCSCACGMKLAQCRMMDPNCSYSKGLAATVVNALRQGKTEAEAIAAADASSWAHMSSDRLLDDPVKIPVAGSPVTGPPNAPVTIVEFSDFQCPYCIAAFSELRSLLAAYPTQVRLIFKQFPLDIHSQADLAASAALAAHKQGKFWPMHDALFSGHDLSRRNILALAGSNGLDMKKFQADLESTETRETIQRDLQDGENAGVQGTPTIFVNGRRYNGRIDVPALKPILEAELHPAATARQTASAKQ